MHLCKWIAESLSTQLRLTGRQDAVIHVLMSVLPAPTIHAAANQAWFLHGK